MVEDFSNLVVCRDEVDLKWILHERGQCRKYHGYFMSKICRGIVYRADCLRDLRNFLEKYEVK